MNAQGGSIVLISSTAALHGLVNHEAIAAAKGGIVGLVRSAAATYADKRLRFNAVAPGLIATSLTAQLTANEENLRVSKLMHPLGRIGTLKDIVAAILFFLNPDNDWVTGQVLAVDGGLSSAKSRIRL